MVPVKAVLKDSGLSKSQIKVREKFKYPTRVLTSTHSHPAGGGVSRWIHPHTVREENAPKVLRVDASSVNGVSNIAALVVRLFYCPTTLPSM